MSFIAEKYRSLVQFRGICQVSQRPTLQKLESSLKIHTLLCELLKCMIPFSLSVWQKYPKSLLNLTLQRERAPEKKLMTQNVKNESKIFPIKCNLGKGFFLKSKKILREYCSVLSSPKSLSRSEGRRTFSRSFIARQIQNYPGFPTYFLRLELRTFSSPF